MEIMELLGRRREDGNLPLFHRKAAADEPPEGEVTVFTLVRDSRIY